MDNKVCKNCQANFPVDQQDHDFYERMNVSSPTQCPQCRMQRRLAFRNDRSLYKSKSALSGKPILTMYNPENGFAVYDEKEWWGEGWDPMDYGMDFDFTRPFFPQFAELQKKVPRFNLFNTASENCDYVNYSTHSRNCYLTFGSWYNEDCLYGQTYNDCKNCVDNLFLDKSQFCYQCIDLIKCYQCAFSQQCSNSSECYFCYDCNNCNNCIGCWNLRNKEYYILNKKVSKEEFELERSKMSSLSSLQEMAAFYAPQLIQNTIHKYRTELNNEGEISGDFIFNCKNAKYCFSAYESQDLAYCARLFEQKDSYDFEGGGKGELTYENMSNDFSFNSISCTTAENMTNAHYSDLCFHVQDSIGCVGLRHKQYCFFNKQYTKEEYEVLEKKIIKHMKATGEWGEFFPVALSLFAYNETLAQEYFPMTKEEVLAKGWRWKESIHAEPMKQTSVIPDCISDVEDNILSEVLSCQVCKKNYKITPAEFKFYQKLSLPIPIFCPDCRHKKRFQRRNPRKLWERNCKKCGVEIKTSFAPEKTDNIYCEKCYEEAII